MVVTRSIKRIIIGIFVAIVVLFLLGLAWVYNNLSAPSRELNNQLRAMISNHDEKKMKNVAIDGATYKFLSTIPPKTVIIGGDFQGGGFPRPHVEIGYFPAQVGSKTVNCFMVQKLGRIPLYPNWQLVKVSLSTVGIDPRWAEGVH